MNKRPVASQPMQADAAVGAQPLRLQASTLRVARGVFWNLALAAVYLGVARIFLVAATEHRVVSSIWPPAGIAVFALIRFGPNYWPGVAAGAFALNALSDVGPMASLVIAVGDTLEAVVGAYLVRRVMGQRRNLGHVRDVLAVTGYAGGLSTLIAATVGVGTLVASGGTTLAMAPQLWLVWWTGDAVGVLIVAPLLLVWTAPEMHTLGGKPRGIEAGLLFLGLAIGTDWIFSNSGLFAFAVYPLALVIAWRFGPRGAATAAAVVTAIATWRTLSGYGPFTLMTPTANLAVLQVFLALLAVKSLTFAAAHTESLFGEARLRGSERRYRHLAQNLPDGCVVLFDQDLRLLVAEGPAIAGAGFTRDEVEGKRIAEVFDAPHADSLAAPFMAGLHGADVEFEFTYKERIYLVRVLPIADSETDAPLGMAMALDVTERSRAERELIESRAQLEQLSRLLLTAQEDERRRVAREVHDELGQALTAVKIGLSQTMVRAQRRNSLESERRAQNASDTLDRAIEAVQRIVLRLRPGVLDNLGPLAALEHEVQQFHAQSGIEITLTLPPEPIAIAAEQSTVLYRTVQEALTNIMRHAKASHVSVSLVANEHDFVLHIIDDGIGISADQLLKPRSIGLLGMRERAAACEGRLEVTRVATGGTCVMLQIPRRITGSLPI